MLKKLAVTSAMLVMLSGCYMVPMALVGPVTSGFSTASIIQAGVSSGTNYMVKKSTGKTIGEHAIGVINKEAMQQSYFPKNYNQSAVSTK